MVRSILILLAATTLAQAGPIEEGKTYLIRDIVTGTWGTEFEGAKCSDNPHTLTFSAGGQMMTLAYAKSLNADPPTKVEYQIIGEGKGFIRMQKLTETETGGDGQLVMWDIVLLGPDSFCWHRSDWADDGCTKPITRCKPEAKK
jgi:hypothetical protein